MLPTANGGRATPLKTGWAGVVWFGDVWTREDADLWPGPGPLPLGRQAPWGCRLRLLDDIEALAPGQEARVELTLVFLDKPRSSIHPGAAFELREGNRCVGRGHVIELDWLEPRTP